MKKIAIFIILLIIIIAGYFLIFSEKKSEIKTFSSSELEDMDLDVFDIGIELSSDLFPEI